MNQRKEPLKLGNFEILQKTDDGSDELLGRGSYGATYKARHRYLNTTVALKVIHDRHLDNRESTQRFLSEAQLVASLDHENIARVSDFGEHEGVFFYAMEFCNGGSLEDFSKRTGPLTWDKVTPIAKQAALALDCAHSAGLIHRDIKPTNLMLSGEQGDLKVKLIDFGLAKVVNEDANSSSIQMLTREGDFVGNQMAAAPEQLLQEELDGRTDLFALGITLWYLLLAKSPFEGIPEAKITQERLNEGAYDLSRIPNLPPHGARILEKLIAKNRDERFPSAADFVEALDAGESFGQTSGEPSSSPTETLPQKATPVPPALKSGNDLTDLRLFDELSVLKSLSSSRHGCSAVLELQEKPAFLIADPNTKRINLEEHSDIRTGTYGDIPAVLFCNLPGSTWTDILGLQGAGRNKDLISWCHQLAVTAQSLEEAGFEKLDFQPTSIFFVSNSLQTKHGSTSWMVAPQFSDEHGQTDSWNSIGGDSLAPTSLAAYASLVYRTLTGMRLRAAAFIKKDAYVNSPNLSETSNRLISRVICTPEDDESLPGFVQFIEELIHHEQVSILPPAQLPRPECNPQAFDPPPSSLPSASTSETRSRLAESASSPSPVTPTPKSTPQARSDPAPPQPVPARAQPAPQPPQPDSLRQPTGAPSPSEGQRKSRKGPLLVVAAVLALSAGGYSYWQSQQKPSPKETPPVVKPEPETPVVPEPVVEATLFSQLDLTQIAEKWIPFGSEILLTDSEGIPLMQRQTFNEDVAAVFPISTSSTLEEWKENAPFRLKITYQNDSSDISILLDKISADQFGESPNKKGRLVLKGEGTSAKVEGNFNPQFRLKFGSDPKNQTKAFALQEDDFQADWVFFPEAEQNGIEMKGSKVFFKRDSVTELPNFTLISPFSGPHQISVSPFKPAAIQDIPLALNDFKILTGDNTLRYDSLVLVPRLSGDQSESKSPFHKSLLQFKPVIQRGSSSCKLLNGVSYDVFIQGGPLNGLHFGYFDPKGITSHTTPRLPTGFLGGVVKLPLKIPGQGTKVLAVQCGLCLAENRTWHASIFVRWRNSKDYPKTGGKNTVVYAVLKPRMLNSKDKKLLLELDFSREKRLHNTNPSEMLKQASIEISLNNVSAWKQKEEIPVVVSATTSDGTKSSEQSSLLFFPDEKGYLDASISFAGQTIGNQINKFLKSSGKEELTGKDLEDAVNSTTPPGKDEFLGTKELDIKRY